MGTLSDVPSTQKIEMPIAENLMVGLAIGMSLEGYLPVVYFERHDFMLVAMDAIVNHLDKIHRISHGEFKPKVILKTVVDDGGLFYSGPTHSQDFTEAFKKIVNFEVLDAHSAQELVNMYEFAMSTQNPVMIVEHKKYF
jgi:pyruvate dehydrogenase E1 component beta subunit